MRMNKTLAENDPRHVMIKSKLSFSARTKLQVSGPLRRDDAAVTPVVRLLFTSL